MEYADFELDKRLIEVVPTERQLEYQKQEFYGFIHFTVNTFTNQEWGKGDESPEIFNPEELDAEEWVKTAYDAGMKGLILTCKHHDGFCLWPSKYTEHSIKNSPYKDGKGDVVREVSDACRKYGIKFGVYLSPWDRNHPAYGSGKEYDDYYINQLTELFTQYGKVYTLWMDGACGEGPNGKCQNYDWERYYAKVRELQPNAVLSVSGPDVRWCGNEAGIVRPSEWSVVSADMTSPTRTAMLSQQSDDESFRTRPVDPTQMDIGSRDVLKNEKELAWYPAETDVSIRPGWFYHPEEDEEVKSFECLRDIYLESVGGNTTLLLNIPPMKNGRIHETDKKNLKMLGNYIRNTFSENLAEEAEIETVPVFGAEMETAENLKDDTYDTFFANPEGCRELNIHIKWKEKKKLSYLVLKENILFSQRVEAYNVSYKTKDGVLKDCYQGTVIGYKKIIDLDGIHTDELLIRITDARVAPILSFVGVF